jgi:hypothetical protein
LKTDNERFFSVELKSKGDLKNLTLTNHSRDRVLVEGSIGDLLKAAFVEMSFWRLWANVALYGLT